MVAVLPIGQTAPLEAHIRDVIGQMKTHQSEFIELSARHGGVMQRRLFQTDYPGLHFEEDLIKSLAEFSLDVDFDFYFLYSDRREDSELT